jgi:hypothetical protein
VAGKLALRCGLLAPDQVTYQFPTMQSAKVSTWDVEQVFDDRV